MTKHTTQTQRAALASCSFFFPSPMHAAGFLVTHRSTKSQRHVNMPLGLCLGVFYCAHASAAARRSTFSLRSGCGRLPRAAAGASETTALAWCGLYAAVLSSCFATASKSLSAGYPQRSRLLLQPPRRTPLGRQLCGEGCRHSSPGAEQEGAPFPRHSWSCHYFPDVRVICPRKKSVVDSKMKNAFWSQPNIG